MIDIELLRTGADIVKKALADRGADVDVDSLLRLDADWRAQTQDVEKLRHEQKLASEEVAPLAGDAKRQRVEELSTLAEHVREAEEELQHLAEQRLALWRKLPNLPLANAPIGADAGANVVRETPKRLPEYAFPLRDYLDIGLGLGLLDVERAARAAGSRFAAFVGDGVLLELALWKHALEVLIPEGFTPLLPPALLKREAMAAMGYLDAAPEEVYATQDDLLLVGTSEQAVGAMYAEHTFTAEELPKRFVAFSSCFRREAGSHGRDVRGVLRLHQFDKVEMFSFCAPADSAAEHARFLDYQKRLMDDLGLSYRVVEMCTGEQGFAAASQFDIETWFPARGRFVETHSTSNTTDFQTRRLRTRIRDGEGKTRLAHAVNGTAYAIQRTLAALLETHQQVDGSVRVPAVLQPMLGGRELLPARTLGA